MRDHEDAFSPTVPDDEDGYVPAPGDPSGERPDYEGEPSFRGANDVAPRPGSVEADEADEYVSFEDGIAAAAAIPPEPEPAETKTKGRPSSQT